MEVKLPIHRAKYLSQKYFCVDFFFEIYSPQPKPLFDISQVLEILDCNGNGFIEYGEFLHWVALQCGLSTSERNKKRKQSDLHDRLQNLVLCIRKAAKIMLIEKREIEARLAPLEKGVDIVFCEFDQDNSGFLNEEKITHLLQKLITPIGHKNDMGSDAREILFALDTDGNGYVEQQEFTDWVLSGLSRPKRSRDIFASHSDFHQRMEQMLTCIEREAMKAVGMKFPEPLDAPLTKDQKAVKDWSLDAPSSPNFDGEGGENGNDLFK